MGEVVKVNGIEFVCFDVYLVPEDIYVESQVCPHCESDEEGLIIEYPASHVVVSTLCECPDCSGYYVVLESPILETVKTPILTRWTVENGIVGK